jgi:multiple sugar transport system ATP-binding protein
MSLKVEDHECMVLVGPSGSGKSTALRIVAGLEEPTTGEVYIAGRKVTRLAPRERNIAMVFQSYALYPHMNVAENLSFGLKLAGQRPAEIEKRVSEVAESLDIGHLLHRKPRQLSGGQRQRVALGRAIVRQPDAFLMDEPLSNLDAQLRVQTRVELERLHRQTRSTVIYVTHDQTEAMTLGDRIMVLKDGRVQQCAPPGVLYRSPANTFVARFTGSPSMNLIPLEIQPGEGGGAVLVGDNIRVPVPGARARRAGLESGRRVLLGVRPEHIRDAAAAERLSLPTLAGKAEVVERLGAETMVYVRVADVLITSRFGGAFDVTPETRFEFGFELDKAHIFDTESGLNLEPEEPATTALAAG